MTQQLPPMPDDPEALRDVVRRLEPGTQAAVKRLASNLIIQAVANGAIPKEDVAIREAMPRFFKQALEAVTAAEEFLS